MRLVYKLPVRPGVKLQCRSDVAPVALTVGGIKAEVDWQVDDDGYLSGVRLALPGQGMTTSEPIEPLPGYLETAFRLAAYAANSIMKQTGRDPIDPDEVLRKSPELQAETEDEVTLLATKRKQRFLTMLLRASIDNTLYPERLVLSGAHERALALYADGMRADDPFVRFEMFYRVMEFFCPNPQNHAPQHLLNCPKFAGKRLEEMRDQVRNWTALRDRSTHPWPRGKRELHRDDLGELRRAREEAGVMQNVAAWFLENPPP